MWTVNEERCVFDGGLEYVVLSEEWKLVHSDEVRALDQIRALDRVGTKTKVRDSHRAGFFRVVNKITLRVIWSFLTNDFDRVFVGAYGSVCAETPKHCAHLIVGLGAERFVKGQAGESDVVVDSDREMVLRLWFFQFIKNGLDHRGCEFFGRQTVTPANHAHTPI